MRIVLKILFFSITAIFTVLLLICQFICLCGTAVLSILAVVMFMIALVIIIFLGETVDGLKILLLAYLISPYGIPILVAWLLGELEHINERLKSY